MLRTLFGVGLIQVLVMFVGIGRGKSLATLLGPAGFGVMGTIDQVVVTVVQVSAFSLPSTALRFMSRSHSLGAAPFRQTFNAFLRVLTRLALVTVMVLSALLAWRPGVFGAELVPYRGYLAIALLSLPAVILHILFVNTLAAAQATRASAVLGLAVALVLAVASIGGALAGGIGGLYAAATAAGALTTGATLVYLRRHLGLGAGAEPMSLARALKETPDIATQSAFVWTAVTAYSATLFVTRYAVLSLLGAAEAGLLQAQLSLALTMGAVVAPMTALYLAPLVNRELGIQEKAAAANEFAAKVAVLLLLSGLPLILFPRLALAVLFSPAFTPGAPFLFVFVLWQYLFQLANLYQQLLVGLRDAAVYALITCAAYLCSAALFPVLIPAIGIVGAGLALVAAMVVAIVGTAVRLRRKFGLAISATVWWRAGYGVTVMTLGAVLFSASAERTLSGIAARGAYAVCVIALMWVGLTAEERRVVTRMTPRHLPRSW